MKLPRDISGSDLARALSGLGYQTTRQTGSHMRLTTSVRGEHHVTIPVHQSLRVGTLAARRHPTSPAAYLGQIFSSTDLVAWQKVAEFAVPAPPYSLARLDGRFYVGLGNEGWTLTNTDTTLEVKSGTIWRVQ